MADNEMNEQAVAPQAAVVEQEVVAPPAPAPSAPTYVPPAAPEKKKNNWWKWALIALLALGLLGLCSCGAFVWLFSGDSTDTTTVEEGTVITPEQPAVIEEEVTTGPMDGLEYRTFMSAAHNGMRDNLMNINSQLDALDASKPTGEEYATWKEATTAYIAGVRESAQKIVDFDGAAVPEMYRKSHDLYVLAARDYLTAMGHLETYLDSGVKADRDNHVKFYNSGNGFLSQAVDARGEETAK